MFYNLPCKTTECVNQKTMTTEFLKCTNMYKNQKCCFHGHKANIRVNVQHLRDHWAMPSNREVLVELVSLRLLFIREVKAGGDCVNAATGPLLHVCDCNEQKVALADNRQQTRVLQLTSIIFWIHPIVSVLSSSTFCLFFVKQSFYYPAIKAYQQWLTWPLYFLICVPGQSKGLLNKRTKWGARERERAEKKRPQQMNVRLAGKQALLLTSYPCFIFITACPIHFLLYSVLTAIKKAEWLRLRNFSCMYWNYRKAFLY